MFVIIHRFLRPQVVRFLRIFYFVIAIDFIIKIIILIIKFLRMLVNFNSTLKIFIVCYLDEYSTFKNH